jgi:hypothetical protein
MTLVEKIDGILADGMSTVGSLGAFAQKRRNLAERIVATLSSTDGDDGERLLDEIADLMSTHDAMSYFASLQLALSKTGAVIIPANRISSLNALLGELLCIVHRDGGQYIAEHGVAKAQQDAIVLSAERIARLSEMREALEWWDRQATCWLDSRVPEAKPGWMRPAIDKGRAALNLSEGGVSR